MRTTITAVLLAALLAVAGCDEPPPAPSPDEFERMVMEHYVGPLKVGDVPTWMEAFDDDAVLLPSHEAAVVGKGAVREWGTRLAETFRFRELLVSVEDIRIDGNWAMTRGSYTSMMAYRETSEPAPGGRDVGKFVILWERQPNERWQINLVMANTDREAAAGGEVRSYEQQLSEDAAGAP